MQVEAGSHLICRQVRVNSSMGTALVLEDKSSAYLKDCTLSSYNEVLDSKKCPGLLAKNDTVVSMFGSTVELAQCGVCAGRDGGALKKHNTFQEIEEEEVTLAHNDEYKGQVVQPWPEGWSRQGPTG